MESSRTRFVCCSKASLRVADEQGRRRISLAMPPRETLAALVQGLTDLLGGSARHDPRQTPADAGQLHSPRNGAQPSN